MKTTTKKVKKVKAWAVFDGKTLIRNGLNEYIIGTKQRAKAALNYNRRHGNKGLSLIAIEINYSLPTNRKTK